MLIQLLYECRLSRRGHEWEQSCTSCDGLWMLPLPLGSPHHYCYFSFQLIKSRGWTAASLLSLQSISFVNKWGMFTSQARATGSPSREEMMCESDTAAWKLVKTGPVEMSVLGVFLQRNSISGSYLSCFREPGGTHRSYHGDRITTIPLPPATLFVFAHIVFKMCSQSVALECGFISSGKKPAVARLHVESRRGRRSTASSHILLNSFHF